MEKILRVLIYVPLIFLAGSAIQWVLRVWTTENSGWFTFEYTPFQWALQIAYWIMLLGFALWTAEVDN